ncbi:MAG: methylenetetrahydrofolate--tRNA-(uracil(54)-C(5))-methyltransferase (FADH(2)-oxidizing) TrmFO [Candidatus Eremiobacteraeota bacterium]|nr:methylenetetrahydrofolate--tRNA-(uracil(54)-C(5))-methyltransferase (FADH(2)-oxidizing) TrmFO [Candidatus Eremiobacteraeota bacterium]
MSETEIRGEKGIRRKREIVTIIGGGLAGCEAAYQVASSGVQVKLIEMRPTEMTPVHKTGNFAELVCSNSLGSDRITSAPGLLKAELRKLSSLIIEAADKSSIPAGQALAVDREKFSHYIESKIQEMQNIEVVREETKEIPRHGLIIIATGPLTSSSLSKEIQKLIGEDYLFFFDAVSPIITAESINFEKVFEASRYGKGTADYLNCPMNSEEYKLFYNALITAERVNPRDFEKGKLFEGCMPIEEIADRGEQTLFFGPLKPVGLDDNATAVVQLRKENREGTLYNPVGFQTRLKWGEQKRIIRMIPGLENAEIVRYGVMHRNIYIHSPLVLDSSLCLKKERRIFFAGQITGVEGYVESAAMGLLAGINAVGRITGKETSAPPVETMIGSLVNYITDNSRNKFQPMNSNFGILPPVKIKGRKKERREAKTARALKYMDEWLSGKLSIYN